MVLRKRLLTAFIIALSVNFICFGQTQTMDSETESIRHALNEFFLQYRVPKQDVQQQVRLQKVSVNNQQRKLTITVDSRLACMELTPSAVNNIYKKVSKALPKPYNKYRTSIVSNGLPIEELLPDAYTSDCRTADGWSGIEYDGEPWTQNLSRPNAISKGLFRRHISLWASHGIYFDQKQNRWKWQRPNLFGTTEDLFTQTFVVPFLIPMLENAGATVFTPRERDWQRNEVIVDNDHSTKQDYFEFSGRNAWTDTEQKGFGLHQGDYADGENPFQSGTCRVAKATSKKNISAISYQPTIPEEGRYAVYVSYQSLDNSIPDAKYTVYHQGRQTTIQVNQRMGGSTWVYLGTFRFDKGNSQYNRVELTNSSSHKGVVTADAVRFGGGMGNIRRNGSVSGMPRCLEGARYTAQWSGVPYSIYSTKSGKDDYGDDINVRPLMSNWLAGGSVYLPTRKGNHVPIELSLAVHSDAGYSFKKDSIIGSLSICTTNFNDGMLGCGASRMLSKDFADSLLTGLQRDLTYKYGKWTRRYLWDRNYSETRNPEVPSAIIETMSHQNFADMLRGHDPNFKFTLARSLYKSILRFVNHRHGRPSIVQPLPPKGFRAEVVGKNKVRLSWIPVEDPQEPTASPTAFIVYTAIGQGDFDNGQLTKATSLTLDVETGLQYNFRVAAANRGGESFPTPVLSAIYNSEKAKSVLIVNGFTRLSGPSVVDEEGRQGFDLAEDLGVSYGLTAGWNGRQQCFDKSKTGIEGEGGLGYCGNEMAGSFFMGNDFSGVATHAESMLSGKCNVSSCTVEAVETEKVSLANYDCTDLLLGLQKDDGHSLVYYKSFGPTLQKSLSTYTRQGGRLLVSGAYVASDMTKNEDEQAFVASVLKIDNSHMETDCTSDTITGLGMSFDCYKRPGEKHYASGTTDILQSAPSAYCAMQYADGGSAAVAYDGQDYKCFTMGFPFECIKDKKQRQQIMSGILQFLLK